MEKSQSYKTNHRWSCYLRLAILVCILAMSSCGLGSRSNGDDSTRKPSVASDPFVAAEEDDGGCAATGRLANIRAQRLREGSGYDYPIGDGDVLKVTIANLPEVDKVEARVSEHGLLSLPLIGEIQVAGLTEEETRQLIADKDRRYQKTPLVHVFVERFASRNVQVMGMVAQPGPYVLNGPDDTLLSVLGRAGGLKGGGGENAAERVVLFPALSGASPSNRARELAIKQACANGADGGNGASAQDLELCRHSDSTLELVSQNPKAVEASPGGAGAAVEPIIVDLDKPSMTHCLDLPARPGDVVLVPAAGQVGVYGWVAKPGTFPVTSGMTALGAVTAAGGAMFSSKAAIMRTSRGARVSIPVDLVEIEHGAQTDVPVKGGDVILVKRSVIGAAPYAVYVLVEKFGTGLYLSPAGL